MKIQKEARATSLKRKRNQRQHKRKFKNICTYEERKLTRKKLQILKIK